MSGGSDAVPADVSSNRVRGAAGALIRRGLADARVRTIAFAYLFAAVSYIQPVAYRHTYPTVAQRVVFAHSFAHNKAVVLFYGKAYDLLTVGGYSAWRVGGTLAIFAAVWGLLASVRAMRAEEDAGRAELILAGCVSRRTRYLASLATAVGGAAALAIGEFVGLVAGGLPYASSAYLSLATASVILVFLGVGALASQLAPTRRTALELGGAVIALSFLLRVISDSVSGASWLRWGTPLGWAEELRPFTGTHPLVFLLPGTVAMLLLWAAARIGAERDVGTGLLSTHDTAEPRLGLLSSPTAHALRAELTGLLIWLVGIGLFAFITGVISKTVSSVGISRQLQQQLAKLGSGSVVTPRGYLGFTFIFFVLAVSLFAVSQVAIARHEEADQQLETLLALPVGRRRWLGGRLLLAACAATAISLLAGFLAWGGAASQGVAISLPRMLEAGANCLPVAFLFLALAALAYSLLPRASAGIAYGLVAVAFLWQLFGSLFGAPRWLIDLTPFAHVGLVPAQSFRAGAAAIMVAIAALVVLCASAAFERRDLLEA